MHLRQSARLLAAAGALLVAAPALTSCGFDYATDRDYTPGAGTNDRDADVDVLAAVVVSAQEGSGTFIASFANNSQEDEASVTDLTATTADGTDLKATFSTITIPAGGLVNLADDGGVELTGDFGPGDFLDVTITFGDGSDVEMEVPTYTACGDYEGLDESGTPDPDQCTAATPAETEH